MRQSSMDYTEVDLQFQHAHVAKLSRIANAER